MAEGRMLKKKISLNEMLADLANDTHRLLFTWGIPHLDVEGRLTGNARRFKALVAPLLDHINSEMVLAFFQDAESLGLIQRYEVEGEWHVQYPKFHNNQNLSKNREAASKRPAPPVDCSLSTQRPLTEESLSTRPEVKISKVNESKQASAFVTGEADNPQVTSLASQFKPSDLVKLWNELGCQPLVSKLSDDRRKKASLRLRKQGDSDWWARLFEKVKVVNKPWLTFDFLMRNDTNVLKVLEGNYDQDFSNRGNGWGPKTGQPGQRAPRGYDQRRDHYVVEVPDPE